MRETRVLANSIEEVRRKFKERMSDKQLFDMDTSIFKKTEEKKNIMSEKHRKKLTHLQQQRTREKSRDISHSTHKNEQKKTGKTVSTVHISSDCTSVPLNTVKSKPKRANKRHGLPAQNSTDSPNDGATADENSSTKRRTRRFVRCSNRNAWKKAKKRTKQIARGKKTVLNLSDRRLSDDDFILLGKGLSFCPKTKSHDKIKLAEELFKYTRRMRLKEFFFEPDKNKNNYSQLPFFNRKQSSFTPPNGRDVYLDIYIEAISQEILHSEINGKRHSNI